MMTKTKMTTIDKRQKDAKTHLRNKSRLQSVHDRTSKSTENEQGCRLQMIKYGDVNFSGGDGPQSWAGVGGRANTNGSGSGRGSGGG